MPMMLLPKDGTLLQAYGAIAWHRVDYKKLNPHKLCLFLGYQPTQIIK